MDLVGTQLPGLNDLLNLDDSDLAAGRRQRIEVLGGIAVHHVAITVGLPALDDGEVGAEGFLEDIVTTVELAHLLALANRGPVEIGSAHDCTPVTSAPRMPSSA